MAGDQRGTQHPGPLLAMARGGVGPRHPLSVFHKHPGSQRRWGSVWGSLLPPRTPAPLSAVSTPAAPPRAPRHAETCVCPGDGYHVATASPRALGRCARTLQGLPWRAACCWTPWRSPHGPFVIRDTVWMCVCLQEELCLPLTREGGSIRANKGWTTPRAGRIRPPRGCPQALRRAGVATALRVHSHAGLVPAAITAITDPLCVCVHSGLSLA